MKGKITKALSLLAAVAMLATNAAWAKIRSFRRLRHPN